MFTGVALSVLAALAYAVATILQTIGVRHLRGAGEGATLAARGRAGAPYLAGLGFDALGFVAAAAALHSMPLFFVQAVSSSAVAITAVLAVLFLGAKLSKPEIGALGLVLAGLIALAAAAAEGPSAPPPHGFRIAVLLGTGVVLLLMLIAKRTGQANLMALASGLGFSGVGIAARIIEWEPLPGLVSNLTFWALLAHAAVAMVAIGLALDMGEVTTVTAINFAAETIVPAIIGLVWLGDEVRPGTAPLAVIGFIATLSGCMLLTRQSEPGA